MIRTNLGYAHIYSRYDALGNKISESYADAENRPVSSVQYGYASYLQKYENGNVTEIRYYDTSGKPVLCSNSGCAVLKYQYDKDGNKLSEAYYDTNEKPVTHKKYHCAGIRYAYDSNGRTTDIWYYGTGENLLNRKDLGYAHVRTGYDKLGNKESEAYFNTREEPTPCKKGGYYSWKSIYKNGNSVDTRYFNEKGEPMLNDEGYAAACYDYDEHGQLTTVHYYGIDGAEPVMNTKEHCAGYEYRYDETGNRTQEYYLGLDGKPKNREDLGFACVFRQYSPYNLAIREEYRNSRRQLIVRSDLGYAAIERTYDGTNLIEERCLNADNHPLVVPDKGYAIVKHEYNEDGQLTAISYYDENEIPVNTD